MIDEHYRWLHLVLSFIVGGYVVALVAVLWYGFKLRQFNRRMQQQNEELARFIREHDHDT